MKDTDLIALAALLHDIGKFGQRAEIEIGEFDWQNFCPRDKKDNPTHKHAAYTAKILGDFIIEKQKSNEKRVIQANALDGKFIDASAKHHKPETENEWIVAVADRLASGFERDPFDEYNHKVEEEIKTSYKEQQLDHLFAKDRKFKLDVFKPDNIFPTDEKGIGYSKLWDAFKSDLEQINGRFKNYPSHLKAQALEYLLKKYTTFIPSATSFKFKDREIIKPNIPLYEHLKTTSIFTSAIASMNEDNRRKIFAYYQEGKDTLDEKLFLLIAGDFFGIQNFIFDEVQTKFAAKTLRAKSAYIQLLIKVLAYYVCEKLEISPYSIITTHAGKFEILAPNENKIKEKLKELQKEFDEHFANEFFGTTGVGLAYQEATIGDFILKDEETDKPKYKTLRKKLADKIELIKYQKFDLKSKGYMLFNIDKDLDNQSLCDFCHKRKGKKEKEYTICSSCDRFVKIGQKLTQHKYIAISKRANKDDIQIFEDFYLHFFDNPQKEHAKEDIYIFDISKDTEFNGMEKWELSSYVATEEIFKDNDYEKEYINKDREEPLEKNEILTLEDLAKLSVKEGLINSKREKGVEAIMALKGDGDGMGNFIKDSDVTDSFAKYNFFAKMIDYYFSVYVPNKFMQKKPLYTVFAGGDDLFILGGWDEVIQLAQKVRDDFVEFTNKELTFSVGLVMSKAHKPINFLANSAEEALEESKDFCCEIKKDEKNNEVKYIEIKCPEIKNNEDCNKEFPNLHKKDAITLFDETIYWENYEKVKKMIETNFNHPKGEEFATTFLYRLMDLCEKSKNVKRGIVEDTIWKSKLSYLYSRNISNKDFTLLEFLDKIIDEYPKEFKANLFEYIYKRRS